MTTVMHSVWCASRPSLCPRIGKASLLGLPNEGLKAASFEACVLDIEIRVSLFEAVFAVTDVVDLRGR
jgi:hypothetical protein